jgi:predicted metal-dependent enzyme (double-stranded beta helix superfamily)
MNAVDVRLDHLAIAARYAADPSSWPVAPRFRATARWYHRLAQEADHEVWLLTWLPGQGTDLHDHGGSAGAFQVVAGVLAEDSVTQTHVLPSRAAPRVTVRELSEGIGRRFGTRHIHRITNRSDRPAVSVHVYGPALTSMTRYQIGAGGLDVLGVEKAGTQW